MRAAWRLLPVVLAAAWLLTAARPALADEPKALPFNKQTVYNYFKHVEQEEQAIPEELPAEEYTRRLCRLYVTVMKNTGYDFDLTVKNAAERADKGRDRLSDPHFLFLAGVFKVHPDLFLEYGLISKQTRDVVMGYFKQQ